MKTIIPYRITYRKIEMQSIEMRPIGYFAIRSCIKPWNAGSRTIPSGTYHSACPLLRGEKNTRRSWSKNSFLVCSDGKRPSGNFL